MRDAQGNVLAVYEQIGDGPIKWKEQHNYGSSRVGLWKPDVDASVTDYDLAWYGGRKRNYELTNHLGNVLATVFDDGDLISATDYYPFGMAQRGRSVSLSSYRYGFNGKENDNEVGKGDGGQQDYGMRVYDARLGRFLSVDPIAIDYPWNSTYAFAENEPVSNIDLDGLERVSAINKPTVGQTLDKMHARKLLENMVVLTAAKCHPSGQVISDQMNAKHREAIANLDFKNGQVALPRSFVEHLFLEPRTIGSLDYQLPPEAGLHFSREMIDKNGYATGMPLPIMGTPLIWVPGHHL
ncbi:RHS repeat-associated core domain-containing protein [Chitinophaga sedimenti]|uniref:RHS repeat domain-containing protein n=1 Tax=Chitinophaga sedimenti TaxID=2033606 RepID=UPI002006D3DE|nr:RHS repeat-associated core domain-containing protein [Chitinophaga sedimenti]MCK7556240.1 RHS repeat-associated core domain-containing protein [Chitinophaga sedimenti]